MIYLGNRVVVIEAVEMSTVDGEEVVIGEVIQLVTGEGILLVGGGGEGGEEEGIMLLR